MKLMIDSGAHSLFKEHIGTSRNRDYTFFESDVFWKFVDEYVLFLKDDGEKFSAYVNVDVIFNPELSWKVQKYMEKRGLCPLPVFHSGENFKWLKKYIDNYDYVGIGGLGQSVSKAQWILNTGDPAFNLLCNDKGYPRVKVHGFAMTSPDLMIQYPFFSVDSTSWMQFGKFGLIIVPRKVRGNFVYDQSPLIVNVSSRKARKSSEKHFDHLPNIEKIHIHEYLEMIGLQMGKSELEEKEFDVTRCEFPISKSEISDIEVDIEKGVCNNADMRDQANLRYYLDLEANIPSWPRKWDRNGKAMMTRIPM